MDFMLRRICCGDSSKAKYMHFALRMQVAFAKEAAMLVLPVPAVPETKMLLPLKNPLPPNIPSSEGIPVEIRFVDTFLSSFNDVTGKTVMPSSSIKKGYSLVP